MQSSKPAPLKGKVTFAQLDLSAFLVSSLIQGLDLGSHVPMSLDAKAAADKP